MTFNVKAFEIDVTTSGVKFGLLASQTPIGIETPIFLRGFILANGGAKWVVATVEFCLTSGTWHQDLIQAISNATNVSMDKITLQTSHQHDVPFFDELYHNTLLKYGQLPFEQKEWFDFLKEIELKISQSIKGAPATLTHTSFQKAEIHEYASDRRIYQDGKMNWRSTKCQKPELKVLPLGEIDPNLYQCVLWGENRQPLITLNFYASHPQVADGRGLLSSDAPGVALKKMREYLPSTAHLYFAGCGADIGNGKFAGPSKDADLEVFGEKLFKGMKAAFEKAQPEVLKEINWLNHFFDIQIQKPEVNHLEMLEQIKQPDFNKHPNKFYIARNLGLHEKNISSYPFRITKLNFNGNQILFFPAEMFLTYQKYCLEKFSGKTCVAAYGDGFIGYVPEDSDFALGGYEITGAFQLLKPGCEKLIKSEIDKIVN